MRIGIVGSAGEKFTPITEHRAKAAILDLLSPGDVVVSGACHMGGIDRWAIEIAKDLGLDYVEYPPAMRMWEGGYKQRNMKIAENSSRVVCITVRKLPPGYAGMVFNMCYHCGTRDHVKSGGCWTMKYARGLGKETELIVI